MNLAFDARGRLWVTHSIEYPFAAADADQSRDGVTILDGIGADGRATKVTKFADKLNIPIGVLPMPNGREAIVWSIPNIWKLTDTDGDGVADKREVLYGPFDYVDTHGDQNAFRLGLDGWIYACHGFRNTSKIKLKGEGPVVLEMQSGNTYRFRPDGSAIEQISWGQVNPFGLCIDARGDLFNADCHSKPISLILRGGYYDSFGKPHDGLGFAPITTSNDHGSTGIAGIVAYASNHFPPEYAGSMFVGNVVTNIVHRDQPQWRGSSPWIEKPEDFLTCDDWWFHPVDLQLGPDGALYVCDFYNSIIGHYEVDLKHPKRDRHRGRIWRIVYTGGQNSSPPAVPNLRQLDEDQLIERLSDRNTDDSTIRRQRTRTTIQSDDGRLRNFVTTRHCADSKDADENARRADERVQALWLLWRNGQLDDSLIQRFVADPAADCPHSSRQSAGRDAELERIRDHDARPRALATRIRSCAERRPKRWDVIPIRRTFNRWCNFDATAADDVQLIHATRIAFFEIRFARQPPSIRLPSIPLNRKTNWPASRKLLWPSPMKRRHGSRSTTCDRTTCLRRIVEKSLAHVARNVSPQQLDEVAEYIQQKFPNDLVRQAIAFSVDFQWVDPAWNQAVA